MDNVFYTGWQDNNFILRLSTDYIIYEASSWVLLKRNRPSITSTNANIIRKVFGDLLFILLDVLTWVDDYNYYINSVDLVNQHR